MTALEDRLRSDLPDLADLLVGAADVDSSADVLFGTDAAGTRTADPPTVVPLDLVERSQPWGWAAGTAVAALCVAVAIGLALRSSNRDVQTGPADTAADSVSDSAPPIALGEWDAMAVAPMEPRSYAVTAWTGDEVVFWAGSGPERRHAFTDGAAYDPTSDAWRSLEVPGWGHPGLAGAFDGQEFFVTAKGGASRIDFETGIETPLPRVDGMNLGVLVVADGTLYGVGSVDFENDTDVAISRFDPVIDVWVNEPSFPGTDEDGSSLGFALLDTPVLWTGREIIVWNSRSGGPAFDPGTGQWRRLPPLEAPTGLLQASTAALTDAGLVAIAEISDAGQTGYRMATLVNDRWSWANADLPIRDLEQVSVAAAGTWLVVFEPDVAPVTVHVPTGVWTVHHDGPLGGLLFPNAAWTGTQLVIWGGDGSTIPNVDAPAMGAIWTPPPPGD